MDREDELHEEAIDLMIQFDQTYRMDNYMSLDEYLAEYSNIMHSEDVIAGYALLNKF
jgi:predicted nucleotidyltransferase|tara:strand:+ start:788 stop:958 length:171 start_codon:yes stop_codon:yes gene_type:complete